MQYCDISAICSTCWTQKLSSDFCLFAVQCINIIEWYWYEPLILVLQYPCKEFYTYRIHVIHIYYVPDLSLFLLIEEVFMKGELLHHDVSSWWWYHICIYFILLYLYVYVCNIMELLVIKLEQYIFYILFMCMCIPLKNGHLYSLQQDFPSKFLVHVLIILCNIFTLPSTE